MKTLLSTAAEAVVTHLTPAVIAISFNKSAYMLRLCLDSQPRRSLSLFGEGLTGDLSHLSQGACWGHTALGTAALAIDIKNRQFKHTATYLSGAVAYAAGLSLPAVAATALTVHCLTHSESGKAALAAASKLCNRLRAS